MIIIKLQGGLGNQMFQYAAGRSLVKDDDILRLDHEFLEENNSDNEHFTARRFELAIFKLLRARKTRQWETNLFKSRATYYRLLRFIIKSRFQFIKQTGNEYKAFPKPKVNSFFYLDGYFQSENHFKQISPQLRKEFEFPPMDALNEKIKQQILDSQNSVSIHIRRGDYVTSEIIQDVHGVLPYSYYQNALDMLYSKHPKLELFIFSEDIQWARDHFSGANIRFFDHNRLSDSWKDMALMTCCKHHIIANSSFSWWGAWLSGDRGEVYAPGLWFNPRKVKFDIDDFIPQRWTIVDGY